MVTGAVLPSPKKVPRRLRDGDAVETLDAILAELNRQFDERSYAPLQHLEDVILNAANRVPCDISDDFKETYDNKIDFEILKQCLPEVKPVTVMDTMISAVTQEQNGTFVVPIIVRLLQTYLLAPMGAVTAERFFQFNDAS